MRSLTNREKIIAVVCLIFCMAFIAKQVFFSRFVDLKDGLDGRMDLVQRKIAQAKGIIGREGAYDARIKELEGFIGVAGSEGSEMARMASKTEEAARQVGVRVVNVQPLAVRKEKFYIIYPLEVVLEGPWKGIARFIHLIQVAEDSLEVDQMRLEKFAEQTTALRGRIVLKWVRVKGSAR